MVVSVLLRLFISSNEHHLSIYTDGSKQDEKVACAVISPNFTDNIRLSDNSSIFTAEAKQLILHFIISEIHLKNNLSFIQILFLY